MDTSHADATAEPREGGEHLPCARFLHTADLHLSRPLGFLPPQIAEERRRDQRRTLTKIADLAIEHKVELVLVAGDLFDTPDPDPTDLEAVEREFSRLVSEGKRIFIIPGNHDYVVRNSFWDRIETEGLYVFSKPEWESVLLDDLGVQVTGIAFDRGNSRRRAFEGLQTEPDMPSIVLMHSSYESFEGQLESYHPFSMSDLASTTASYVALGHYHRFTPIRAGTTTACYPGTPEGISFDKPETEQRVIVIGEIGEAGNVTVETAKTNRRVMRSVDLDCSSFESQVSLLDAVRRVCAPNALVHLRLTGSPTSDLSTLLNELPERFRESCFHLAVDAGNLCQVSDLPIDDLTIRGRFCRHLLDQTENATDPDRQRLFRRALELGLAAFAEE